jgi:hypothetical protein
MQDPWFLLLDEFRNQEKVKDECNDFSNLELLIEILKNCSCPMPSIIEWDSSFDCNHFVLEWKNATIVIDQLPEEKPIATISSMIPNYSIQDVSFERIKFVELIF